MPIRILSLLAGLAMLVLMPAHVHAQSPAPVDLGAAAPFGVLGGSTVTNTGNTSIDGDLGVSPGSAVTGFPPGEVTGSIHINDTEAVSGQDNLTTAYNDAAGRTTNPVSVAGNLGGQTLAPGLYKSTSTLSISSGDLTLDGQGDPNAVWIFQMSSSLTVTSGRQVILAGSGQAANVFWQVGSSATIGTNAAFKGSILADQSITLETGASLEGRALARIGAVSLDGNAVTVPSLAPDANVTLTLPTTSAEPDASLMLHVSTNDIDGKEVRSYEFTVTYDSAVVKLDGIETFGSLSADATVTFTSTDTSITVSGNSTTDLAGSGTLVMLTGMSRAEGTSDLRFESVSFNSGTPNGIGVDGRLDIGIGLDAETEHDLPFSFALRGNYPNPFNPSTEIVFDLSESAIVSIRVFNILGRVVLDLPATMVMAGPDRRFHVEAAGLPSGIYVYRVLAESATTRMTRTGRMTLIK